MAEIKYIPYRDDEIDEEAFWKKADEEYENYLNSRMWARNSPEKRNLWILSYNNLRNMGVTGITGTNINHNGTAPIDNREYYGDVADFLIRNIAPNIKTKKALEEEAKKKEEERIAALPEYNFDTDFPRYMLRTYYGNNRDNFEEDWNSLDKADKYGIRKNDNRKAKLLSILLEYKKQLKYDDFRYNTDNSPFIDKTDLENKLNKAIEALKSPNPDDDKDALNLLGLHNKFLSTGENNRVTYGGQLMTAAEARDLEAKATKQAEAEKIELQKANQFKKFRFIPMNGVNGTLPLGQNVLGELNSYYNLGLLSPEQTSKLVGTFLFALKNNALKDLSKEELARFGSTYANNPGRLKKIDGLDGFYYDTIGNRIILPFMDTQRGTLNLLELINANDPNLIRQKQNLEALSHKWGEGLTDDMIADLTALGLDAVSAGSAFAPGYGTAVSAISGIGATLAGAYADRARGESWGSTLGSAGFGLSMDILGLIPGVGIGGKAAKMARIVSKGAKWIGPLLLGYAAFSYGPGALSAFNKFTSGKTDDITAEELRDFTYAMRAIALGGVRKAGSTYLGNRTLARARTTEIKSGKNAGKKVAEIGEISTSPSITTKNGLEIKLTNEEFNILKSNASRETKAKTITQAALREKIDMKGDEIEWKGINPVKGRFKTSSKSSDISGLNKPQSSGTIKWNTTASDYKGIRRFSNENLLRGYTLMGDFNNGTWRYLKDRWKGNDILNSSYSLSALLTEAIKQELKALPKFKKPYISPLSQEVLPASKRLPQPGGEHKGTIVDNTKTGTLNTTKINTGDAVKEFTDFLSMYISSGVKGNKKLKSKPFGNGYGTNSIPQEGTLEFNGLTATLTKLKDNKGFSITFGKTGDTVISRKFKDILLLRNNFARQLNGVLKKQDNIKETAALLRLFKAMGWLKYGGNINNIDSIIQKYLN